MVSSAINTFFSAYTPFSLKIGEVCIPSEQRTSEILYLQEGVVKQTLITQKGQELCLNLYKSGSFFPLMDGIAGIPNAYTFSALTGCKGFKAPAETVRGWLRSSPEVSYELNVRLLKGLHGLLLKTASLMQGNARALLVQTLLTLSQRFPSGMSRIGIPLTHQKLADLTGLSRETVTRELTTLKQLRLLAIEEHTITLLDTNALACYVDTVSEITAV